MSNNERKTSKLAIAGLIVSVAVPGLFFLCVLVFENLYKQLNGALEIFMLLLLILPFISLPLSIVGMMGGNRSVSYWDGGKMAGASMDQMPGVSGAYFDLKELFTTAQDG